MRPHLKPALRRAWRGPTTLQFGVSPGRGAVLEGLTHHDVDLLDRLRIGLDPNHLDSLPSSAPRTRALLELLREAGLLIDERTGRRALARLGGSRPRLAADAAAWSLVRPGGTDGWGFLSGRTQRRVVLTDGGRTGSSLAATLVGAGVGSVVMDDHRPVTPGDVGASGYSPRDVGRPRDEVVAEFPARLDGGWLPEGARRPDQPQPHGRPDLVVLLEDTVADSARGRLLLDGGVPHLSVVTRDGDAIVGPLVQPGDGGPCLNCLDLHRRDRDPEWPSVLAQLLGSPAAGPETALAVVTAGIAALQVLGLLDGQLPSTAGATLEVELPDGLMSRRVWPPHPRCECRRGPGTISPTTSDQASDVGSVASPGRSGARAGVRDPTMAQ